MGLGGTFGGERSWGEGLRPPLGKAVGRLWEGLVGSLGRRPWRKQCCSVPLVPCRAAWLVRVFALVFPGVETRVVAPARRGLRHSVSRDPSGVPAGEGGLQRVHLPHQHSRYPTPCPQGPDNWGDPGARVRVFFSLDARKTRGDSDRHLCGHLWQCMQGPLLWRGVAGGSAVPGCVCRACWQPGQVCTWQMAGGRVLSWCCTLRLMVAKIFSGCFLMPTTWIFIFIDVISSV